MPDNAFGLADEQAPETDPFADSPEVDETPEEEITVETTEVEVETEPEPQGDPLAPTPEPEAEEGETAEDEAETEAAKLPKPFLGKYETVEAAEAAYNELRREQVRLDAENRQKEEWLRVAAQTIEEARKPPEPQPQAAPTDQELQTLADQYGVDVETIKVAQAMATQQVQAQVAPLQQQMQTTQEQQRAQQEWAQQQQQIQATMGVIQSWKQANPIDEATESLMVDVFEELELDENLGENYPIALEVAQNPGLRSILNGLPDLVNTDQGMQIARDLASGSPDTQTPRVARNTPEARRQAHVESGPSGATPPTSTPKMDAWDKVKALAIEDRKNDSPLGV